LGEVTIQAYCVLDAYLNGFAFQEKTVSFKTAEEAAVLAREEVRKFADLAEERQVAARSPMSAPTRCGRPVVTNQSSWSIEAACMRARTSHRPGVDVLVSQDVGRPVSVLDDRLHRGARGAAAGGVDRH